MGTMAGMNITGKGWYSAPSKFRFPTMIASVSYTTLTMPPMLRINDRHVDY